MRSGRRKRIVVNYRSVILGSAVTREEQAEELAEFAPRVGRSAARTASSASERWMAPAPSGVGAWRSREPAAPGGWNGYLEVQSVAVPARRPTKRQLRKARQKFFSSESLLHIWMSDDVAREKAKVQTDLGLRSRCQLWAGGGHQF